MLDNKVAGNALLIDLDGVIYQSDRIIAGAIDALDWIKQQQIPYLFVTNTTSRSRGALLEKFATMGFNARLDEIVTPIVAAMQWLGNQDLSKAALFVTPSATDDFDAIKAVPLDQDAEVDAVIIGYHR